MSAETNDQPKYQGQKKDTEGKRSRTYDESVVRVPFIPIKFQRKNYEMHPSLASRFVFGGVLFPEEYSVVVSRFKPPMVNDHTHGHLIIKEAHEKAEEKIHRLVENRAETVGDATAESEIAHSGEGAN